jgi:hypothetical protein
MAVVYCKIGQALLKQNRYMKRVCSNPVRRSAPSSSFKILKFIRNRRTFFVCLITVLCFGIGNIPVSVWYILEIAGKNYFLMENVWTEYLAEVLRVARSHSVNPLIYGILDKNLSIRNRRIFLVCLITVLCFGIGNIPMIVYLILTIAEEHNLLMK